MTDKEKQYLEDAMVRKIRMNMFLSTGIRLEGEIEDMDGDVLFIRKSVGVLCMVYRRQIVSVTPKE